MLVSGVPIENEHVLRLARTVTDAELGRKLLMAYTLRSEVLNLRFHERQAILSAIENQPSGLEALHERLVATYAWRVRERL